MLGEGTRDELISLGTLREYSMGSSLFTEGDTSNYLVALRSGWVKVVATTEEGGLSLLALGSRGDLIGEQASEQPALSSHLDANYRRVPGRDELGR